MRRRFAVHSRPLMATEPPDPLFVVVACLAMSTAGERKHRLQVPRVSMTKERRTVPVIDPAACNGHVDLCERRLDEVTLATSHNAMSSTASGFLLPNHLTTMRALGRLQRSGR